MDKKLVDKKLVGHLRRSGLNIVSSQFIDIYGIDALLKLYRKLKVKQILFNKHIIYHKTYLKLDDIIIFPRMKGLKLLKPYLSKIINHMTSDDDNKLETDESCWESTISLLSNQSIVNHYLINNIFTPEKCSNGTSSTILNMKAGQGKSYLVVDLISILKQKTLIVVPISSLLEQWVDLLTSSFPQLDIGYYWSKKKKDGDIIVIIGQSILTVQFKFGKKSIEPKAFFNQFGFIVYDEIHKYCAPKIKKIFNKAQAKYVLGMSATTDKRSDKLDPIAQHHIGDVIYAAKVPGYIVNKTKFKTIIDMIKYKGPSEYCKTIRTEETDSVSAPKMINQICEDPYRKIIVCNELEKIYHTRKNTFIFADRREYLIEIAKMLFEKVKQNENEDQVNIKIEKDDLSMLLGNDKHGKEHVAIAKAKSTMIFGTYQFLDTGISIVKMTNMFILTPRRNGWEQIIGRILRLGSDENITRNIILFCDYNTAIKGQMMSAKNEIKKLFKAKATVREIHYNSVEL